MATRPNKSISHFKGQLIGGGARPNLFEVRLANIPGGNWQGDTDNIPYMCKAASLPASTLQTLMFRSEVVFLKLLETELLKHGVSLLLTMKTSRLEMHLKSGCNLLLN